MKRGDYNGKEKNKVMEENFDNYYNFSNFTFNSYC